MTHQEFMEIVKTRQRQTLSTLDCKADEYARGDRLSNFMKASHLIGQPPELVCRGLVVKHIVALFDFLKDLERGVHQPYSRWDEKIGDTIAYLHLLDALLAIRFPDRHSICQETARESSNQPQINPFNSNTAVYGQNLQAPSTERESVQPPVSRLVGSSRPVS